MLDYSQKKKTRKLMYSVPVLFLLFIIFAFLSSKAFALYQKGSEVRGKAEEVKADLAKLEARQGELQKKVDFLKTERGKEEEMRSRFMIGKEGEGVILVVEEKSSTTAGRKASKPSSWWSGFLNFFR